MMKIKEETKHVSLGVLLKSFRSKVTGSNLETTGRLDGGRRYGW